MGRTICFTLVVVAMVYGLFAVVIGPSSEPELTPTKMAPCSMPVASDFSKREPVPLNRGSDVLDGFRGEVHPILKRNGQLKVAATWRFDRTQDKDPAFPSAAPPQLRNLFLELAVSISSRIYTEFDFSRFLPANEFGAVGQMWALDSDKAAEFLSQFHPAPSMRLVAKGRRAGPDGAFAVLRAISPSHADILFRVHAEFDVMPQEFKVRSPGAEAWYSPAYFQGRMVINRTAGTVEFFQLNLPTDTRHNAHVNFADANDVDFALHGWMKIDEMELKGGTTKEIEHVRWVDEIGAADAQSRLAKVFFIFKNINWIPFEKVAAIAREQKKPILVVSALGALDDQTC